jgi:flavin reductase (DIM6/NTAB) family NADH-FMN oxidoreductase RutF
MAKETWKPGNMLYPLPAVLVTVADNSGNENVFTVAWTGTICTDPAMVYISVRPSRYSYDMIKESGQFVINLTTEKLAKATDYCGVKSGRDENKFEKMNLQTEKAEYVKAPLLTDSPVNIECEVTEIKHLGTHDMFIAKVLCVHAGKEYMDEKGKFDLAKAKPIVYSHGQYYSTGKKLGKFGFAVRKTQKPKRKKNK